MEKLSPHYGIKISLPKASDNEMGMTMCLSSVDSIVKSVLEALLKLMASSTFSGSTGSEVLVCMRLYAANDGTTKMVSA